MSVLVVPRAQQLSLISTIVGATPYHLGVLHLFNNNIVPNQFNVLADFIPAVYSGYTPLAVTWSPAFFDLNGVPVSSSGELLFSQSGSTGDVVYGAYLTDAGGGTLLASGLIDGGPFNFVNNGDTLPLLIKLDVNGGLLSVSPVP
jgi:hypothetical protein